MQFYSFTRSEFPWNKDVMISMYRQGLNPQLSCGLATSRLYSMLWMMLYRLPIKWRMNKKQKKSYATTSGYNVQE